MNWKRKILVNLSILILGWALIAPILVDYLIVQKPLEKADAIVVLSGSAEFRERAQEAAAIFRKGASPRIFLTDDGLAGPWDTELKRNPTSVERTARQLIASGVPGDAIVILPTIVHGTHQEATVVSEAMTERDFRSVILVTSAYHSRRTLSSFEKAMQRQGEPIVIGVQSPTDRIGSFWWLTGKGWNTVGLEWAKTAYYSISY